MAGTRTGAVNGSASILRAPTPAAWVDDALGQMPELLQDHANCEKKAASTALALMFAYPEDRALAAALSRLAREELRHFEQVTRAMTAVGVPYLRLRPGRYAQRLRSAERASISAAISSRSSLRPGSLVRAAERSRCA